MTKYICRDGHEVPLRFVNEKSQQCVAGHATQFNCKDDAHFALKEYAEGFGSVEEISVVK